MADALADGFPIGNVDSLPAKGLEVGRQGVPLLDLIAVLVIEDTVVEIRHRGAVGHLGLQG